MVDIIKDTLVDAIKIFPFLLLAFFVIEIIEHKLTKKTQKIVEKSGKIGPLLGSALGIIPQCGFSVVATNLYITRIITLGTLIAIYLSTSDEMLPILLSEKVEVKIIIQLLLTKFIIGMIAGFIIDFVIRKTNKNNSRSAKEDYSICEEEHCHCGNKSLLVAALSHTLKTLLFIVISSFILNIIMEYMGKDFISKVFMKDSFFSPFLSSLVGLIPNCGASVVLTELYLNNAISMPSLIAGLLTGSGVALLVLFRTNKDMKENLFILSLIYFIGSFSGVILELIEKIL